MVFTLVLCVEIKTTRGGIGLALHTNKEQSRGEWGAHFYVEQQGGWAVRRGQARVQPRCLRAALSQTEWGLLPNWAGEYAGEEGEGADRG